MVGEWVDDISKAGIYTEVEDLDLLAKIPKLFKKEKILYWSLLFTQYTCKWIN